MPFSIGRVVPWGRSAAEYQAMFGLDESDLDGRILGCGDGPASFNAEMSAQGDTVVSVDPLYAVSAAAIERRVEETFDEVMDQMRRNAQEFVWTHVPSVDELGRRRMAAMRRFIADYPRGKAEGRYVGASSRGSSTPAEREARTRRWSRSRKSFSGAGIECCGCDAAGSGRSPGKTTGESRFDQRPAQT